MSLIAAQKSILRKRLLQERSRMTQSEWQHLSEAVISRLNNYQPFKKATCVHSFVSMNERKEVDTHALIQKLLKDGKSVIVTVSDFKTNTLIPARLENFDSLQPNKWGVLEPESFVSTDLEPEVILVPLLAADKNFNRLGYGKGFYDRFLMESMALKIGLLFDTFLLEMVPVEEFDQKLDVLITEHAVYESTLV